jgi:WD40 repeat protein
LIATSTGLGFQFDSRITKIATSDLKTIQTYIGGRITKVKIHPNSQEFIICSIPFDGVNYYEIKLRKTQNLETIKEIDRFETEPSDMAFSPDGKWFAVAGDYVIKLYNVEQGYKFVDSITHKQIGTQRASTLKIYIKDNFLIFGYNSDGRTTIFDLIQNKIIKQYYLPIYAWSSIDINKQNQLLISSSERLNLINNWDKVSVKDNFNVPFQVSYQNQQLVITYPLEINPKSISITDIKGRIIFQNTEFAETKGNGVFDLSLQSGVYFITLTTNEGIELSKKFAVIN